MQTTPSANKRRIAMERRITSKLVGDILAAGHMISVYDGEAYALVQSTDKRQIMEALASTDQDTLFIKGADGKPVGVVALVYGNDGWDVISDHTDTPAMAELLAHANAYARSLEQRVS
jgi:hypothetical protein